MQISYGAYKFEANGVKISSRTQVVRSEAGVAIALDQYLDLEGWLTNNGNPSQSSLTTAENALRLALGVPFQDLVLYQDDGTPSSCQLRNAGSLSGVIIVDGPHFPVGGRSEFASERTFKFSAMAEYGYPNYATKLVSFTETLEFSGGAQVVKWMNAVTGNPQRQVVWPKVPFQATQSGRIVGYVQQPNPLVLSPPKWPFALLEAPSIRPVSPKRIGRLYKEFEVSYSYKFAWGSPLVGTPTLWNLAL